MIFDSHAHYNDSAFDEDRGELLGSLNRHGIAKAVNVCSDIDSIEETLELTRKYDFMYGALGIHPSDSRDLTEEDVQRIREKFLLDAQQPPEKRKLVAVGEIGLDYYWPEPARDLQKKWFRRQMELAGEIGLPVIIHSREACQDTLEILKEYPDVTGIIHCYSYSAESSRDFGKLGYSFGIGGTVTFANAKKLREAVKQIPMDRILLETDCPYLAPVPNRGKRNSSLNIPYIIEEIARTKEITAEEVEKTAWENTLRLFSIR